MYLKSISITGNFFFDITSILQVSCLYKDSYDFKINFQIIKSFVARLDIKGNGYM